ncbi:MAG: rhodanese-like domain-containing protein [Flavobacteriales bacterium]|nr:MAG: rhodanese-like domain-containing protein [Flavobacteriales bacterium]
MNSTLKYILIFSIIFSCSLINNESINQMNSDELIDFIELNDAVLVDVRTEDEYNSGYIESSLNIDYFSNEFSVNADKLDKTIPIILYCRSGKRSSMSANKISKLGFKEIYNLEGGILEWIEEGNAVVFNDTIN